jgi:hypothetical protein
MDCWYPHQWSEESILNELASTQQHLDNQKYYYWPGSFYAPGKIQQNHMWIIFCKYTVDLHWINPLVHCCHLHPCPLMNYIVFWKVISRYSDSNVVDCNCSISSESLLTRPIALLCPLNIMKRGIKHRAYQIKVENCPLFSPHYFNVDSFKVK